MGNQRESTIYLCADVRLNKSQQHTIWFDTPEEQHSYFLNKVVKTFTAYTYLKKSWSIKVDADFEQASHWTYLCFRNGDVSSNRTYFYFIDRVEYKSENTVELFLELDVLQTYHFDYDLLPCFVDREHTITDNIGDHTIDEGLELGEFVITESQNFSLGEMCVLTLSSIDIVASLASGVKTLNPLILGNVYSGLGVYATPATHYETLTAYLKAADSKNWSDSIVSMWMYPKSLIQTVGGTWDGALIPVANNQFVRNVITPNTTKIDNHLPKNNKLFTYPFNFLYVSNNAGGSCTYMYEKFQGIAGGNNLELQVVGSLSADAQIKLIPLAYKNVGVNTDEGIYGPSFPSCAWNQDLYKLWVAQNQNQLKFNAVSNGVNAVTGVVHAFTSLGQNGIDNAVSGILATHGILAQMKDRETQPPQSKGQHSSSVNITTGHQTFTLMKKSVDGNHARIIDDFFTMYGYKCHRVKTPNRNVRASHTYVKTIACQIKARDGKTLFSNDDVVRIQSIYDNGVTFWRNGDRIGEYGDDNSCSK